VYGDPRGEHSKGRRSAKKRRAKKKNNSFFFFVFPGPTMSRKRSITHLLSSLKTVCAGTAGCPSTLAGTAAPSMMSLSMVDVAGPARFGHVARRYTTTTEADTTEKDVIHIADEVYNRQRSVLPLLNRIVHAAPSAYIAPSAVRFDAMWRRSTRTSTTDTQRTDRPTDRLTDRPTD
jgi:hypothetical protein